MKLFLDSADLDEIKEVDSYGILDGVTTNPSLIKKAVDKRKKRGEKIDMESYICNILKVCGKRPVSLEVVATTYAGMVKEGLRIKRLFGKHGNVYVKIPVNPCFSLTCGMEMDSLRAIKTLTKKGIKINCTLIFTPEQSWLAAKAGAKFVSPFAGRIDDLLRQESGVLFEKKDYYPAGGLKKGKKLLSDQGIESGVDLIRETRVLFDKQKVKAEILAASIRNPRQFREVAEVGAHIATLPYLVVKKLIEHKKTAEGMVAFEKDIVKEYENLLAGAGKRGKVGGKR